MRSQAWVGVLPASPWQGPSSQVPCLLWGGDAPSALALTVGAGGRMGARDTVSPIKGSLDMHPDSNPEPPLPGCVALGKEPSP